MSVALGQIDLVTNIMQVAETANYSSFLYLVSKNGSFPILTYTTHIETMIYFVTLHFCNIKNWQWKKIENNKKICNLYFIVYDILSL